MSTPAPRYFKAWFIFFLIATVGGFFLGAGIGAMIGFVLGLAQVDLTLIKIICGGIGFVISLPLSYFTFRWVVAEFIVKPLTAPPPPPPVQAPPAAEPPPIVGH